MIGMSKRDGSIAFAMFLVGVCCFSLLYYPQPLLPLLSRIFRISTASSSLCMSFTTIGMTIGLFVAMFVADTIGRKKVITSSLFLASLAGGISSLTTVFYFLVALSFVKGFFLAGAASVALAYVNEEVVSVHKGRVTGLYIAGGAVGGMFGRVAAAYLGEYFSWSMASFTISFICTIFTFIILWKSPCSKNFIPTRRKFKVLFVSNIRLLTNPTLLTYCFVGALTMGVFVSIYNYVGFYLDESPFYFSSMYIKNIYWLYTLGLIGSVGIASIYRYITKNSLLIIVLSLSAIGILLLYIPWVCSVTVGLGVITAGFFITHVTCSYLVSNVNSSKRSVAISIYLLLYYTMSSLWGYVSGIVLDKWGWQYYLGILLTIIIIALLLVYRLMWIGKHRKCESEYLA